MTDQEYQLMTDTIRSLLGIDLDNYKTQQMRRRLDGLVSANSTTVGEYCRLVGDDKEALSRLKNFITINVSEFFRDKEQFNILRDMVLPELLKQKPQLKIWSAGCSHGGEPYSVMILLQELAPGQSHSIVATDLDDKILAKASEGGPYMESDVANVDPKHLLKYFTKNDKGYWVTDGVRRAVQFSRHNMLSDPFALGFDLVICRNVVIYFSDGAKDTLYKGFHKSLKDNGILFIGATETLLSASNVGFERMHNCYYKKTNSEQEATSGQASRLLSRN